MSIRARVSIHLHRIGGVRFMRSGINCEWRRAPAADIDLQIPSEASSSQPRVTVARGKETDVYLATIKIAASFARKLKEVSALPLICMNKYLSSSKTVSSYNVTRMKYSKYKSIRLTAAIKYGYQSSQWLQKIQIKKISSSVIKLLFSLIILFLFYANVNIEVNMMRVKYKKREKYTVNKKLQ